MTSVIGHRGPDGHGEWSGPFVSLGATRLAIIDPQAGTQPIWNEDRSLAIVMNGEIYNSKTLRLSIQERHEFHTATDTETVLHLFEEHGPDCFRLLDGIFAIAITDGISLWLARDGMGVKPLVYSETPDAQIVFASELKSLLVHEMVSRQLDLLALAERHVFQCWTPASHSLLKGVESIAPGTCLHISPDVDGRPVRIHTRFFTLPDHDPAIGPDLDVIRHRLVESICSQLATDVPWGVLLSGGVDSSLMSIIIRSQGTRELFPTFTLSDGSTVDEANAGELARLWDLPHTVVPINEEAILCNLARQIWAMEDPSIAPMWFLCSKIPNGIKMLLCGEGADELFAGYFSYNRVDQIRQKTEERLRKLENAAPGLAKQVRPVMRDVFGSHDDGKRSYYLAGLQGQLATRHLASVDMGGMAHGLEVRVPFLSTGLVTEIARFDLPTLLGDQGATKQILRDIYKDILTNIGIHPDSYKAIWGARAKLGMPSAVANAKAGAVRRLKPLLPSNEVLRQHPCYPLVNSPIDLIFLDLFRACYIDYAGCFPSPLDWQHLVNEQYPTLAKFSPLFLEKSACELM